MSDNVNEIRPGASWTAQRVITTLQKLSPDVEDIIVCLRNKEGFVTSYHSSMEIQRLCFLHKILERNLNRVIDGGAPK